MSSEETNCPWKSGVWYNENNAAQLCVVDGEKMEVRNMMWLDFPESKSMLSGAWTKGRVSKDVADHDKLLTQGRYTIFP